MTPSEVLQNLLTPITMFFALGLVAALLRSDLELPEPLGKSLSLYLMAAIGLKGGHQLALEGVSWQTAASLAAAVLMSALLPIVAFTLLRLGTRLDRKAAAAVAAHYGSISIVTFVTASSYLASRNIPSEGELVAMAALMETPTIITSLLLARGSLASVKPTLLRKVLFSGSILLLLGSFAIGFVSPDASIEKTAPFFVAPFQGVLCLFLLDMGLIAGRHLGEFRRVGYGLIAFGVYMPLVGAVVGLAVAALLGFSVGGMALTAVLGASASYIVVPAAMRMALPEVPPSLYITTSLALTFPFNIVVGIPLYLSAARILHGWLN